MDYNKLVKVTDAGKTSEKMMKFYINEDNVYDLIHEGTTHLVIPSDQETNAFVASALDLIQAVLKDCGHGARNLEHSVEGNILNIYLKN